jgi:hypothetical protein
MTPAEVVRWYAESFWGSVAVEIDYPCEDECRRIFTEAAGKGGAR